MSRESASLHSASLMSCSLLFVPCTSDTLVEQVPARPRAAATEAHRMSPARKSRRRVVLAACVPWILLSPLRKLSNTSAALTGNWR